MDRIKATLKEKFFSEGILKLKKTWTKIDEVLCDPYAQIPEKLRAKKKDRLRSGEDPLWKKRADAFCAGILAGTELSLDELSKRDVVVRTFSGPEFRVDPVFPLVLEDEKLEGSSKSHIDDVLKEMRYDSAVESGVLLARTETEGFIYQPGNPKDLGSLPFPLNSKAFAVLDKSLQFLSLHCGDEVEFRLRESEVHDLKVIKYGNMTSKEMDDYIDYLSGQLDPLSSLLTITNSFPIWRYILYGNDSGMPALRLMRAIHLANEIAASEATTLHRETVESLFLSFAKPAFLKETLLPCCTTETDEKDFMLELKKFVSNFVALLPRKANIFRPAIKHVARCLSRDESNDFLWNTLETVLIHQQVEEDDDFDAQPWNSVPLIMTPKELRIAFKENHNLFADLPYVRLKQPYKSVEDYFETYFTLLRKDCYGQLCDVIRSAKLVNVEKKKYNLYKIVATTGIYFFPNGRGMAFLLKFEPLFEINWNDSEALKGENLVCISLTGNFDDQKLIWATIASQRSKQTNLLNQVRKPQLLLENCSNISSLI